MDICDNNLYYIGGIVRDELLGVNKHFDIDLTYQGDAIEFAKNIPNADIIQINESFGTVKIKIDGKEIDIASTRGETYPKKGHLPQVKNIGCDLKEDILRRDFTVNALAKSTSTGEIIDYVGGLADLKTKTLRVLHDGSFIDDPTRIIRGLKFAVRFGFELEPHTKFLQDEYLKNVNYDMSYKRLKKELVETFNLNRWSAFKLFVENKMYKLITSKEFVLPSFDFSHLIDKYKPENTWIIYIGLLSDISVLPLSKIEKKIVDGFVNLKAKTFTDDFEIFKNFSDVNTESVIMYSTINAEIVERYFDILKDIRIKITGKDLINLGQKPSENFQKCFDFVLREKLKNPVLTKEQEIEIAKSFFS